MADDKKVASAAGKKPPAASSAGKKPATVSAADKKPPAASSAGKKPPAVPKKKVAKKKKAPAVKRTSGMKVNVYSLDGGVKKQMDLPPIFNSEYRPDLIRRVVKASRANRRQAYGPSEMAGKRHATDSPGKGRGMARTPRIRSQSTWFSGMERRLLQASGL